MSHETDVGTGLGTLLLLSVVFASIYFTVRVTESEDIYYYSFVGRMDAAIDEAYGAAQIHEHGT